jgi:carboxyl-terminal processing protease
VEVPAAIVESSRPGRFGAIEQHRALRLHIRSLHRRSLLTTITTLLALCLAACSDRTAGRLSIPRTATPLGATATAQQATNAGATPSSQDIVVEAYRALNRSLVLAVSPASLVQAAWDGLVSQARSDGVQVTNSLPSLGSDADQDYASFAQARDALLASAPAGVDESQLNQAAATAMAEGVNDCHTAYLTAGQWDSINADLAGQEFIGSLPLTFQLAPPFMIESVVSGSNAAQQSIQPGDQILAVDGTPIAQIPLSQRKFLSAGAPGTSVQLQLMLPDGSSRTVSVSRENVDRPVVMTEMFGAVGYIKLRTFTSNLSGVLDPAIDQLQAQGAQGFVIDLRGNLGGELDSVAHLLSRFIPSGVLATTNERNRPSTSVSADGSVLPGPPPLAVLVDGGSLSASELFASDVQQYHAGELVGTPTPGCLLGSTFRTLSDGSSVQISVLNVQVGPGDVVVNHVGVQPDVVVENQAFDFAAGLDPQLNRAVSDVQQRVSLSRAYTRKRTADTREQHT